MIFLGFQFDPNDGKKLHVKVARTITTYGVHVATPGFETIQCVTPPPLPSRNDHPS